MARVACAALFTPALFATLLVPFVLFSLVGVGHVDRAEGLSVHPPPSPGTGGQEEDCKALERSVDIENNCVLTGGPSELCCRAVHEAVRSGGLVCLCKVSFTPRIFISGYRAADLIDWYHECGGTLPVDFHLGRRCGIEGMIHHTMGVVPPRDAEVPAPPSPPDVGESTHGEELFHHDMGVLPPPDAKVPPPPPSPPNGGESGVKESHVGEQLSSPKGITINIPLHTVEVVGGILLGLLLGVLGLVIIGLFIYTKLAAPGPRRDEAQNVLDTLLPLVSKLGKRFTDTKEESGDEDNRA